MKFYLEILTSGRFTTRKSKELRVTHILRGENTIALAEAGKPQEMIVKSVKHFFAQLFLVEQSI
jgi:hypothetical protein